MASVAVRVCPVCLQAIRVTSGIVWTHLDTVGNLCPMSDQVQIEKVA